MSPVEEAGYLPRAKQLAYLQKKKYWPYYGRGHIQNTWKDNYFKLSALWKEITGETVDFVRSPELLLQNRYSVPLTFEGFHRGIWTGKDEDDFIDDIDESDDEDLREFANARRIVNGTDRQVEIGKLSLIFEKALRAAGYGGSTPIPVAPPEAPPAVPKPPVMVPGGVGAAIGAAVTALLVWLFG
jgi:hypothetical protein